MAMCGIIARPHGWWMHRDKNSMDMALWEAGKQLLEDKLEQQRRVGVLEEMPEVPDPPVEAGGDAVQERQQAGGQDGEQGAAKDRVGPSFRERKRCQSTSLHLCEIAATPAVKVACFVCFRRGNLGLFSCCDQWRVLVLCAGYSRPGQDHDELRR
jgi:hypothetical protein